MNANNAMTPRSRASRPPASKPTARARKGYAQTVSTFVQDAPPEMPELGESIRYFDATITRVAFTRFRTSAPGGDGYTSSPWERNAEASFRNAVNATRRREKLEPFETLCCVCGLKPRVARRGRCEDCHEIYLAKCRERARALEAAPVRAKSSRESQEAYFNSLTHEQIMETLYALRPLVAPPEYVPAAPAHDIRPALLSDARNHADALIASKGGTVPYTPPLDIGFTRYLRTWMRDREVTR